MSEAIRFGVLLGLLLGGNLGMRVLPHGKPMPPRQDLALFPQQVGGWVGSEAPALTDREKKLLGADEYVMRFYDRNGTRVGLFIGYYRSQKSGDAMHSPKNCLPGAGWEPISSSVVQVPRAGSGVPFEVNHLVVGKDGLRQDVLYWYQASGRAYASEYRGKVYLVWDAITRNRTDGAIVRITAGRSSGAEQTPQAAMDFAQDLSGVLPQFLPN